jgi:hypothetical protein
MKDMRNTARERLGNDPAEQTGNPGAPVPDVGHGVELGVDEIGDEPKVEDVIGLVQDTERCCRHCACIPAKTGQHFESTRIRQDEHGGWIQVDLSDCLDQTPYLVFCTKVASRSRLSAAEGLGSPPLPRVREA